MVFDMNQCGNGVHVFTDMEGDYDSFLKYWIDGLHRKGALTFEERVEHVRFGEVTIPIYYDFLHLADGHCIANLGDMLDQGVQADRQGVFRGVATFNALKRTYPSRVQLVLGNRDVNKFRLTSELSESSGFNNVLGPFAYHTEPGPLKADELPTKECTESDKCPRPKASELAKLSGSKKTKWFKWILSETMGAGSAFEGYKRELLMLTQNTDKSTLFEDEDKVTDFVLEQLGNGGLFYEFLKMAGLVAQGGSALFVHGNLPGDIISSDGRFIVPQESEGLGIELDMSVPPKDRQRIDRFSGGESDPSNFAKRMFEWKQKLFQEWDNQREFISGGDCDNKLCRGGNALIDMALGGPGPTARNGGFSVSIISTPAVGAYKAEFAQKLLARGIKYIFTGHIPQGAVPQAYVEVETGVTIVNSDLTYAHPVPKCASGSEGWQHCITDVSTIVTFTPDDSSTSQYEIEGKIRATVGDPESANVLMYWLPPSKPEASTCSYWAGPGQLSTEEIAEASRVNPTTYQILDSRVITGKGIDWADSKPLEMSNVLRSKTTMPPSPFFAGIVLQLCE